jgi:hypothetical protein
LDDNVHILKVSRKALIQLLHDWQEKVCKLNPQEVIITYENDTFTLMTSELGSMNEI